MKAGTATVHTYTITVSNGGPSDATLGEPDRHVAGRLQLRARLTPSQGSCSGSPNFTCNLGTIAAGGTATVTATYTVPSSTTEPDEHRDGLEPDGLDGREQHGVRHEHGLAGAPGGQRQRDGQRQLDDYPIDVFRTTTCRRAPFSSVQKTGVLPVPGTPTTTTDQGGTATYCATCGPGGMRAIRYTPAPDYVGPDGFDYTITDGVNYSTAHVTIDVVATGSLDSQLILEDANINDLRARSTCSSEEPEAVRQLGSPAEEHRAGHLHLTARIFNHTNVNTGDCTGPNKNSCTIDNANGNRVVAVLTIPDMPTNCGGTNMRPYTNLSVNTNQDLNCSNPGGLGAAAFPLQGGNDGKDAVHAHPDDKTDDMKVLVQYLTYALAGERRHLRRQGRNGAWSTTLPAERRR